MGRRGVACSGEIEGDVLCHGTALGGSEMVASDAAFRPISREASVGMGLDVDAGTHFERVLRHAHTQQIDGRHVGHDVHSIARTPHRGIHRTIGREETVFSRKGGMCFSATQAGIKADTTQVVGGIAQGIHLCVSRE